MGIDRKYTPGPWKIAESDQGPIPLATKPFAIKDSEGNYIAVLGAGSVHFGKAWANAPLIAAAPELLEAMEAMLTCFPPPKRQDDPEFRAEVSASPLGRRTLEAHDKARAAIAKARGEAS